MSRSKCVSTFLALWMAGYCSAQTPDPPATPAPSTSNGNGNTFTIGAIDFSGLIDGYYSYNFNHPASKNNNLRNFDATPGFGLNLAKLTIEHTADPVGFKLELAGGKSMEIFHATEPGGSELYKHLFQAYVSLKPESWKGVQFDFGKFVTSAGAEVTETHLNWNYSRSLLFANGPYYHFGARTTLPVHKNFTAGVQLVNGWNNVQDNNSGKTVGLTGGFTSSKFNWYNNYYVGNEKTDVLDGIKINGAGGARHFWDTVVAFNPTSKVNFLFNFDYGVEKNEDADSYKFYGYSIATRLAPNDTIAISPRFDWYHDRDGFITGQSQKWKEFTLTFDTRLQQGFLARFEYRRDWSDQPFFDRGNGVKNHKNMDTLLAGFVVYFGPKR